MQEQERRSITRTIFSDSKDHGGRGHVETSLVQRDLQFVETLGDMASDFFVGLALRGCLSILSAGLLNCFKMHASGCLFEHERHKQCKRWAT